MPDSEVRELLAGGDTFHWFVVATTGGRVGKSNLETVRFR
jgi:hypothetical protein